MNKVNVTKLLNTAKMTMKKRSPEILTGLGIAGMISTVVLAVKATPKAMELISDAEEKGRLKLEKADKYDNEHIDALVKEVRKPLNIVKVAWKPYIPAAVTGVASIACIVGANSIHARRHAVLYSAYKLSETAFNEYKDKVVETVGEKKEKVIREKVAQDKITELKFHDDDIVYTGNGNTLFFDPISKTIFKSSRNSIEKSINDLNYRMSYGSEPYMSLNEFYNEIKIPHYELGDELGWRTDKSLIDIAFIPSTTNVGEPCLNLEYNVRPEYNFDDLY